MNPKQYTNPSMTLERATHLVRGYTAHCTEEQVAVIANRMVEHDECVWHAAAVVSGHPCWCADCDPMVQKRRAERVASNTRRVMRACDSN
jgi:hypothetical protein